MSAPDSDTDAKTGPDSAADPDARHNAKMAKKKGMTHAEWEKSPEDKRMDAKGQREMDQRTKKEIGGGMGSPRGTSSRSAGAGTQGLATQPPPKALNKSTLACRRADRLITKARLASLATRCDSSTFKKSTYPAA